jgi:hypothetical protein
MMRVITAGELRGGVPEKARSFQTNLADAKPGDLLTEANGGPSEV